MTRAERKSLAALDEKMAALDSQLDNEETEDDGAWQERESLDAERQTLIAKTQEWDKDIIALAGVMVRIDHDGRPHLTHGLVAKADQAKLKRLLATRAPEGAPNESGADTETEVAPAEVGPKLSKALARDLTSARAAAIRAEVARTPDIALSLAVHALLNSAQSSFAASVNIRGDQPVVADLPELESRRASVFADLPACGPDLLKYCLSLSRDRLLDILAALTADTIDVVHDGHTSQDRQVQRFADEIATAVVLDMRRYWTADVAFLSRLSKSMLMDILATSPAVSSKRPKQREAFIRTHAKLKRDALAKAVARTIDSTSWLPDLLVTPVAAGDLVVTPEGEAAISSIAAE